MNARDAEELLRRMVEIASPSGQEQTLAAFLAGEMSRLGFRSSIDEVGNVVGMRGGDTGPVVLLLGHMDTVPDLVPIRRDGDLFYGRGTVDAKGALATMICAAAQLDPTGAQIIVIGAVEEETPGSRGAHYIRERYMPDAVVIGEPSGWSGVTLGYKGRIGIHYDVQRPLSHMAGSGEKATEVAVTFWNQLTAYFDGLGDDQGLFRRATAVLGAFAGNIERAHLDISCRVPPGFDFDRLDAFLATIRQDARIDIDERTPAVLMDRSSPTARALTRSIRLHGGRPVFKLKTGTSDMNVVAQRWQVPMVAYGPGDSNLDHTPGEHLDFNEYHSAIAVLGDALSFLIAELRESRTDSIYSEDEEAEVLRRLADLGYL